MKLSNQDLIEEFYEGVKEDYPTLTFDQVRDVAFGPWRFLKTEMETGELPEVRLKYFGVFTVFKGRAVKLLGDLPRKVAIGTITKEKKKQLETMIIKYLNRQQ